MSTPLQSLVPAEQQILGQDQDTQAAVAVVDPITILQYVQMGAAVADFIGRLVGGKTGSAISDVAGTINGFGQKLLNIANELQKVLAQVDAIITSVDQSRLSDVGPVHNQITTYIGAFPGGVPEIADARNISYVFADDNSKKAITYFQAIKGRGPLAFIPSLCHATNSRMELAVSAWPCWYVQNSPAQPDFNQEVNLSHGILSSHLSSASTLVRNLIKVKQLMKKLEPDLPLQTVGWQVIDDNKVVWTKMDPDAGGEALAERQKRQSAKVQEILGDFNRTRDHWVNMSARFAPAGIARALELGDATTFLRYVNPSTLVMEEPEESARTTGVDGKSPVYRALPMRDILLDMLTSDAMRARHGLLVKGADKRAVSTWFEKTFFRQPSPAELAALVQVTALFGSSALFGCLAWSDEYKTRFGDGIPGPVDRRSPAPSPGTAEVM